MNTSFYIIPVYPVFSRVTKLNGFIMQYILLYTYIIMYMYVVSLMYAICTRKKTVDVQEKTALIA